MLELDTVRRLYAAYPGRVARLRRRLKRPLTFTEKVLYSHLVDLDGQALERGKSFLQLCPDRVAMQDATAQMALLQFISSGRERTALPTSIHCDHLVVGRAGAEPDLQAALQQNREVYDFLAAAARKYGLDFWKPGSGIIHQVVLENYAFPAGLLIGTDSHTPNAGGMGMGAVGVGGADAVDAMVGMPWELLCPQLTGVRLTGRLNGWVAAKDVILKLLGRLTCAGGTNKVIEYFGPGVASISLTGRGTITNMGAELGATCSLFPADARTLEYLRATRRGAVADLAAGLQADLAADPEVYAAPERYYDEVLEINLDELEPLLAGPHSPDLARSAAELVDDLAKGAYPDEVKVGLIGSCTNSSYEDIGRAAHVARQAVAKGLTCRAPLLVTPGSDQVYATVERDGFLADLRRIGATILANACGPCIGQWKREDVKLEDAASGKPNVIVTSFNRNFRGRNDGMKNTLAFVASPELVVAKALAGRLSFNPLTDTLPNAKGQQVRLDPPAAADLPAKGFAFNDRGYQPPAEEGASVALSVAPDSERLQLLAPFPAWDEREIHDARVLVKAKGKCTTDHISPAGPWLRFRGHLDRISDNLLAGAVNAFTGEAGAGRNLRTGEPSQPFAKIARDYKAQGIPWVVIGDANYGEGSSREHAALEPRHLGGRAVIVRSFARIHETNLKKQGMLALTFRDPADYDRVREDDSVGLLGLKSFAPRRGLVLVLKHSDGSVDECQLEHSYSAEQIGWFKAGAALNLIRGAAGGAGKGMAGGKKTAKARGRKKANRVRTKKTRPSLAIKSKRANLKKAKRGAVKKAKSAGTKARTSRGAAKVPAGARKTRRPRG